MNCSTVQRYTLLTTPWLNPFVLPPGIKGVLHQNDLAGRESPPKPQMPDADVRLRISDSPPGNPTLHGQGQDDAACHGLGFPSATAS